ncbi:hypothetical protein SUGI_0859860 [Cryptomeria japonica]|nr:hypothetical protein SUGI_0859860 [Cryptomeria japonica]
MSPLSCPSVFQPLQVDDGHYRNDRKDDGPHFKILPFPFVNTDYDPPIIHEDITSSKILLDESFCSRIADFGLASFKSDVELVAEVLDVQRHARSDVGHRIRNYAQRQIEEMFSLAVLDEYSSEAPRQSVYLIPDYERMGEFVFERVGGEDVFDCDLFWRRLIQSFCEESLIL